MEEWLFWGSRSREGEDFIICRFNWTVLIAEIYLQIVISVMAVLVFNLHPIVPFSLVAPLALIGYIHFWRYTVVADKEGISLKNGSWPFKLSWSDVYACEVEAESTSKARKVSFAEGLTSHINFDPDLAGHGVIRFVVFFNEKGDRIGKLPLTFIAQSDKEKLLQIIEVAMQKREEICQRETP